ncbi:DNA damage-binding protein 1 [Striga asiatica]|uniref:DNA damage-binding protein 1 n=1 Tax=Striga asiatica TaxID=4170 RepID=A0A5A7PAC1_STRAF|nr:DNA damage-binding protein 1 [Striga asiatica]
MGIWDYVLTAPTNVTHSCVGNFTAPNELNLIVAKCTRIEIHLLSSQGLQLMLDMPIYGRIAILELFRPHGETQDHLIMVKEAYQFSVLQWDAENAEFITRAMADVSYQIGIPAENRKIGIVDPDCRLIGLHLYDGIFKVIPFDNKGKFMEAFDIRFEELRVLDIKFLYGCPRPTIVVLYQDAEDVRHMKTYEVALKDECFAEGPWSQNSLDNGAELLIPVPPPLCGVLIIGEETIVYCSASAFKAIGIRRSITKAYGRVDADGSRYLLGDHKGLLHLLVITHDREKVTGLKIELLGKTCIASSISYLDNDVVFICSSYGDSQMIKLNLPADAKGSHVEVLKRISPKSVHGGGPGVFKGWSPNMAFLSAIPNQVGNFAKFTTKSLSAYFSSWNFYPGPAASAAPGDIISWSSNLSLPGPAAPGDTVSSSMMHTIQESNSSTQPPLEVQAVPREGDMAMQIEKGYAPPALTIKPVQGKTWKRAASKVCRLARESETTQVIPSPKHNKITKEES